MPRLLLGGLSLTVVALLVPVMLGDLAAGVGALVALALWLVAASLGLLLWARSTPPRPALLFSVPVCAPPAGTPGAVPIDVCCYDDSGAVTLLPAELLPAPAG